MKMTMATRHKMHSQTIRFLLFISGSVQIAVSVNIVVASCEMIQVR